MAPVRPRRPLGAAPTLVSARVQESRPRNGRGKSGHIAKHDLDDVPDRDMYRGTYYYLCAVGRYVELLL